jgi:hypothetical protein
MGQVDMPFLKYPTCLFLLLFINSLGGGRLCLLVLGIVAPKGSILPAQDNWWMNVEHW